MAINSWKPRKMEVIDINGGMLLLSRENLCPCPEDEDVPTSDA